jgi:hypothetical protein
LRIRGSMIVKNQKVIQQMLEEWKENKLIWLIYLSV